MQKLKPNAVMHGTFIKSRDPPEFTYRTIPRTSSTLEELLETFEADVIQPYKLSSKSAKESGKESGKEGKSTRKCCDRDREEMENELDRRLVSGGFFPCTIDAFQVEDLSIGRVEKHGKAGKLRVVYSDYFAYNVLSKRYPNPVATT